MWHRTRILSLWSGRYSSASSGSLVLVVVPIFSATLGFAPAHTHVSPNSDAATLLSDHPAQSGALGQAWELLRTEDLKWLRLHFQAVIDHGGPISIAFGLFGQFILILGTFELLVQAKAQPVLAFMADRQIRKNEIARRLGPIQVHHSGYGSASQDWRGLSLRGDASVGNGSRSFQSCEQEIIGMHSEGDVRLAVLALEDLELYNWWRVDRPSVGRCCERRVLAVVWRHRLNDDGTVDSTHIWHLGHMLGRELAAAAPSSGR